MIQSTQLKHLFSEQLKWYREHKHDDSLIYDEAWEQFGFWNRGNKRYGDSNGQASESRLQICTNRKKMSNENIVAIIHDIFTVMVFWFGFYLGSKT